MDSMHSEFVNAYAVIEDYANGKNEKCSKRFAATLDNMKKFVAAYCPDGSAFVNELVLAYAVIDYFDDIERLKKFHKTDHVNGVKIVAYLSYWLLRRKPIQLRALDRSLVDVNERYVMMYMLDFLKDDGKGDILLRENAGLLSFADFLLYYLKYRDVTAKGLEMMLVAFQGGRIYQESGRDISAELERYKIDGDDTAVA